MMIRPLTLDLVLAPLSPGGRGVGGEGETRPPVSDDSSQMGEALPLTPNPSPPGERGTRSPLTPNPSPPGERGTRSPLTPNPSPSRGEGGKTDVHVWVADLAETWDVATYLNNEEVQRANRYHNPTTQTQFRQCRGRLRWLLAQYLACDPSDIALTVDADGKPFLRDHSELQFNVSHTEGIALYAISHHPVGVDVERFRVMANAEGLVRRFFAEAEQMQFRTLPMELRDRAFLRGWTCKEAVLKGVGCGARGLDRCVVELHPDRPARVLGDATLANEWELYSWNVTADHIAALATKR